MSNPKVERVWTAEDIRDALEKGDIPYKAQLELAKYLEKCTRLMAAFQAMHLYEDANVYTDGWNEALRNLRAAIEAKDET